MKMKSYAKFFVEKNLKYALFFVFAAVLVYIVFRKVRHEGFLDSVVASCPGTGTLISSLNGGPCPTKCPGTGTLISSLNDQSCPTTCPGTGTLISSLKGLPCPTKCLGTGTDISSLKGVPCPTLDDSNQYMPYR